MNGRLILFVSMTLGCHLAMGRESDPIAVAQGRKLCDALAPIYQQVQTARKERRASLLPSLDAPERAKPDVLTKARAIRDEYVKECMKRAGWDFDSCWQGDLARPLTERIVKVSVAQKNFALAYAENELLKQPDQSSAGAEFLGEVRRHPVGRRLAECVNFQTNAPTNRTAAG